MTGFLIIILCGTLLFLLVQLFDMKRQLRKITKQLHYRLERQEDMPLSIEFIDRDIEKNDCISQ